jgi:hypothetical protein
VGFFLKKNEKTGGWRAGKWWDGRKTQGSCIYFESTEKPQNFQEFKPQSRRSRRKKKEKDALPKNLFDLGTKGSIRPGGSFFFKIRVIL